MRLELASGPRRRAARDAVARQERRDLVPSSHVPDQLCVRRYVTPRGHCWRRSARVKRFRWKTWTMALTGTAPMSVA